MQVDRGAEGGAAQADEGVADDGGEALKVMGEGEGSNVACRRQL